MPKRLIHSVSVAEFDELKGNTLSYVYPENPTPVITSHQRDDIAELCLPDGGHKRSSDCIYILLTGERNTPLYGFAYFRNRESAVEKRGAKQLALLIVATSPYFDRFKPFLSVAVEEYLDNDQSKLVIHQLYSALEKSYRRTRRLAVNRHKSYDSLDLALESSDEEEPDAPYSEESKAPSIAKQTAQSAFAQSRARPASVSFTPRGREKSFDPQGAENLDSVTPKHEQQALRSCLAPPATTSGASTADSKGDGAALSDHHASPGPPAAEQTRDLANRNSVCFAKLGRGEQGRGLDHLGLLSSSCTYTMHLWGRMFVMRPLSSLQGNEFGGISLKNVVLKLRVQTMTLWAALVGLRRVLVCGPESQADAAGALVLATPLMLGPLGALIIPNLVPYATLANVDPLTKHSSYVCGTTNGLFATKEDWYDLAIDPKDGKVTVSSTSQVDRNQLKVQGSDLAFITRVLDGIENGKREEDWVRFEFSTFTQDFLDSVRELEMDRQLRRTREEGSSSTLVVPSQHKPSASDASVVSLGLVDGTASEADSSRSRLRSVQIWRHKTKTGFLKRKHARTATERLAKTFAGSPLWLRYRWMQLNPESYTSSRKHLSRVVVIEKSPATPASQDAAQSAPKAAEVPSSEAATTQSAAKTAASALSSPKTAPDGRATPPLPRRPPGWRAVQGSAAGDRVAPPKWTPQSPPPPKLPLPALPPTPKKLPPETKLQSIITVAQPTKQSPTSSGRLGLRSGSSRRIRGSSSCSPSKSLFRSSKQRASKKERGALKGLAHACVSQRESLRPNSQALSSEDDGPKDGNSAGDPAEGPSDDFGSSSGRSFSSEGSHLEEEDEEDEEVEDEDRTALYYEELDTLQPPPPLPTAAVASTSGNKWRTALTPDGRVYLWNVDTKKTRWPSEMDDESSDEDDAGSGARSSREPSPVHRRRRLQPATTAPPVGHLEEDTTLLRRLRSWSGNRAEVGSTSQDCEHAPGDEEFDEDDPTGASKWVMIKGRWQRVMVLMQEDITLKTFRKSDWVEAFTEGGRRFWHNLKSGESTWEQPPRTVTTIVA